MVSVNEAALRFYGYGREELEGLTVEALHAPHELPRFREGLSLLHEGFSVQPEGFRQWTHRRRDGCEVEVETYGTTIEADGRPVRVSLVVDVSARARAEAALRASESRYRDLFAFAPTPVIVWDLESTRVLSVNDAALRFYGYAREELEGQPAHALHAPQEPQEKQRLWDAVASLRSGVDAQPEEHRHWMHRRKDGSPVEVETYGTTIQIDGRPARVTMVIDISERRRAERVLAAEAAGRELAHARLSEMMSRVSDGFIALDRELRFTYLNPAALHAMGCTRADELIGQSVQQRYGAPPDHPVLAALTEAAATGEPRVVEHQSERTGLWFESRIYPSAEGLTAYFTDITELRRLAERVQAAERDYRLLFAANPRTFPLLLALLAVMAVLEFLGWLKRPLKK